MFPFWSAKTGVTNANMAALEGMTQDLQWKNIAHRVGILLGSADKILTQQLKLRKVCARYAPFAWQKNKTASRMLIPI